MQKTCPDWLFGGVILDLREIARISWGFSVGWSCRCSNPGSSGCNAPSKGHWPPAEGWLGTKMEDLGDPKFFGWINFYQILLSIHKNQLFWCQLKGYRVLTQPQIEHWEPFMSAYNWLSIRYWSMPFRARMHVYCMPEKYQCCELQFNNQGAVSKVGKVSTQENRCFYSEQLWTIWSW
jgi:hypothetical protein